MQDDRFNLLAQTISCSLLSPLAPIHIPELVEDRLRLADVSDKPFVMIFANYPGLDCEMPTDQVRHQFSLNGGLGASIEVGSAPSTAPALYSPSILSDLLGDRVSLPVKVSSFITIAKDGEWVQVGASSDLDITLTR